MFAKSLELQWVRAVEAFLMGTYYVNSAETVNLPQIDENGSILRFFFLTRNQSEKRTSVEPVALQRRKSNGLI
jgi:hypothetical protein